jgi:hypothetical protein
MRLIISIAILALSALPALADRQVTEDERAKLAAAAQAEGCTGGKFEMDEDDQQFEVDDAVCADGKKYDLKFDMQMRLKRKNLDWEVMGRRVPNISHAHGRHRLIFAIYQALTHGFRASRAVWSWAPLTLSLIPH